MGPDSSAFEGGQRLAPFELFWSHDVSATVEIQPCRACEPWYLEVEPVDSGRSVFREWHDQHCPHLQSLHRDDVADAD